ncbi:photosystem II cytochrome PsbV2 [Oscillatoria sp. FACHB-1406]|uniref:photosystem II cytochrome PsbV2 n=1 Tax=Oscillatoria sp. FACHB-1406 TaxID=2692846 RepID=UPI0016861DC9|nr:photosystem II cytochrome PsbV2 [Oscillatoria sp. FACHB-1406]MBD2579153.1 photosystem II cytochrome PsbV2 [Oscillatoria sp. FACHB-1406]
MNQPITFKIFATGWLRASLAILSACLVLLAGTRPALAVDKYITRYIAKEPVAVPYDAQGNTQTYTPDDFYQGKELFKEHCIYCHVGGTTVQDPTVSLSLEDLGGATPPRNNVTAIADFMRDPLSYDGSEPSLACRKVTEAWMSKTELEKLAAFVLRAAEKSPGWGNSEIEVR